MFKLREGSGGASISDRGAEDREEGSQGVTTEEAIEGGFLIWAQKNMCFS